MNVQGIDGVVTALWNTPRRSQRLHVEGMRQQIETQIDAGVDALLLLGSMGAMQLLEDATYQDTLDVTLDAV